MAKTPDEKPKAKSKAKSLGEYIDSNIENRQWYTRAADCLKAGTMKFYTGFLDPDMCLLGGFPYGKLSLVSGADSSGKTLILMRTAARVLRTCRLCFTPIIDCVDYMTGETKTTCMCKKMVPMNVLYVDAEDRYDAVWGGKNGLPVKKDDVLSEHFLIVKPSTGELVTDHARGMLKDKILDLIIVDSYAALFPESREGRLAGQQQPGDSAKMVQNMLMTVIHENMSDGFSNVRRCTVIGSQQLRAAIGSYGSPTTVPGGWFLKHGLTTHIAMKHPKYNDGFDKKKAQDESTHYADFAGKVVKASLGGSENAVANWRVYTKNYGKKLAGDSDEGKRIGEALFAMQMAGKIGNKYHVLGIEFDTLEALTRAIEENETFSLAARFVLLYNKLPEDSRSYLNIDRYNYDPFYELVIESEGPVPNGDDTQTLTKFHLVHRDTTGVNRKRPANTKSDAVINKELSQSNPPGV